jgi:hypothetical protein
VTFLALAGATFVIGLSVAEQTKALLPAFAAMVVFAVCPAISRSFMVAYMMVDPMMYLLVAVAVYALVRRTPWLFFAACFVGIFNREAILVLLPSYGISELLIERRFRWSPWIWATGIALVWLVFSRLVLAYTVPIKLSGALPGWHQVHTSQVRVVLTAVLADFGVLVLVSWRALWNPVALSLVPFALGSIAGAFVITDTSRVASQAIPFFILALFSFWPSDGRLRALVLVPAVLFVLDVALAVWWNGVPDAALMPALAVVVCVNEVLLYRHLRKRELVGAVSLA